MAYCIIQPYIFAMNELLVSAAGFWRRYYFIWQLPKGGQPLGLHVMLDKVFKWDDSSSDLFFSHPYNSWKSTFVGQKHDLRTEASQTNRMCQSS